MAFKNLGNRWRSLHGGQKKTPGPSLPIKRLAPAIFETGQPTTPFSIWHPHPNVKSLAFEDKRP